MSEVACEAGLRRVSGDTTRFIFAYFPLLGLAWPVSVVLKCYHILNCFQWLELLQSPMKHGDPYDCHAWTSRMLAFPTLHQLCFNGDHSAQLEVNAKIVQEILGHVLPSMQRNARIECGWNCRGKHIICEENANLTIVPL